MPRQKSTSIPNDVSPNAPTSLIRVRIWSAGDVVEQVSSVVARFLDAEGIEVIERSDPYPCRPPKQLESRVYLTCRKK